MTVGTRYVAGVVVVLVVAALVAILAASYGRAIGIAAAVAGIAQGPLGWWLVRSMATEHFVGVWGIGIVTRFGLLALLGFVIAPALQIPAAPALMAYVGIVMALVFVETYIVYTVHARGSGQ